MTRWATLVPLGKISGTGGTPVSLAVNCGPLAGQISGANYLSPPVPGTPLRQIILTADGGNTGQVYLLPRGSSLGSNPGNVLACIPKGETVAIPWGQPFEGGILPENFVLDSDGTDAFVVYGCGILS